MPENEANTITFQQAAIFEKNGIYAALSVAITRDCNVVSRYDPRNTPDITHKGFETPELAKKWYEEYLIATVTENGWKVIYNGPRNIG